MVVNYSMDVTVDDVRRIDDLTRAELAGDDWVDVEKEESL